MAVGGVELMAFAQVASITPGTFSGEDTQHLVPMPATVNAGDLLVALISNDGNATVTTPAGWNLLASDAQASACRLGVYYRIANGTEGGTTVDFVTSVAETMATDVYRITGWHGTTPPEVGIAVGATTANPDPPSLAPSWGAADTLFIALFGTGTANTASAYPTDYTDGTTHATGGSAASIGSARRELNAASDNPGTFTITGTVACLAQTVVIRPAAGAATADPYPYVGGGYYPHQG